MLKKSIAVACLLGSFLSSAANAGGWSYVCHNLYSESYTEYKVTCRYQGYEEYVVDYGPFSNPPYAVLTKYHNESTTSDWLKSAALCQSSVNVHWGWDSPTTGLWQAKLTTVPLTARDLETKTTRDYIGEKCGMEYKANPPYHIMP